MTRAVPRSERTRPRRVIVVGAGIAGLMTTHELARRGHPVLLLSLAPATQARSATARGGINAVFMPSAEGDSLERHRLDTLRASGATAAPAAVSSLVTAAPTLVSRLDHMGVPFLRAESGSLARFAHGGHTHPRTLLAGDLTGRAILGVLDDQVRRWEGEIAHDERGRPLVGEPRVRRLEQWDLLDLVQDDNGVVVGVVAMDRFSSRIKAFPGDAVCLATGGAAGLYLPGPRAAGASGAGIAIALRAGAAAVHPTAVDWHPTTLTAPNGRVIVLEGLRAEVGAARDSRRAAVAEARRHLARAAPGSAAAAGIPIDLDAMDPARLTLRFGRLLAAAGLAANSDGRWGTLRVLPRVIGSLGGLWVDHEPAADGGLTPDSPRQHATSLPGLYAVGGCESLYHGQGLLGGNDLLACLHGATVAARALQGFRLALARSAFELPASIFERAEAKADRAHRARLERGQPARERSHFSLQHALARTLARAVADPNPEALARAESAVTAIATEAAVARPASLGGGVDLGAEQARHLDHLLLLAKLTLAGLAREGSGRAGGDGASPHQEAFEPAAAGGVPSFATLEDGEVKFSTTLCYDCAGVRVQIDARPGTSSVGDPEQQDGGART